MTSSPPRSYEELLDHYRRIVNLRQAAGILRFDRDAWMPDGGEPARSDQLSTLEGLVSDHLSADELRTLLDDLDPNDLSVDQTAVVREIRLEHERETAVPAELAAELESARTAATDAYQQARKTDDFSVFAPYLETLRDLHIERAEHVAPKLSPYAAMYAEDEPYLSQATVDRIFDRLKQELPPLLADIDDSDVTLAQPLASDLPEDEEPTVASETIYDGILTEVFDLLGFNWDHGLFGAWGAPQSVGNQFDTRIKVRDRGVPGSLLLRAITGTVHELGHAFYDQGLSQDQYGTPLGEPRNGLHETQARFWENHIARTEAFWERAVPIVSRHVDDLPGLEALTPRSSYESINAVRSENLRRVRADELTYHLHLLIRCEIDRAFVAGDLPVEDIPRVWNDKYEQYLGVRPKTDAEGCLQDGHWAHSFAIFQHYMVGSVLAAQLDAAMRADVDVDGCIRDGELGPVHEWLGEHVHCHGRRYPTDELIEMATGDPLTADPFLEYAREKFGSLYDL